MKKTVKKAKGPAKSASKKVAIKDLKAKDAGSVKGGVLTNAKGEAQDHKHETAIDVLSFR
jgi:hypothetical protein